MSVGWNTSVHPGPGTWVVDQVGEVVPFQGPKVDLVLVMQDGTVVDALLEPDRFDLVFSSRRAWEIARSARAQSDLFDPPGERNALEDARREPHLHLNPNLVEQVRIGSLLEKLADRWELGVGEEGREDVDVGLRQAAADLRRFVRGPKPPLEPGDLGDVLEFVERAKKAVSGVFWIVLDRRGSDQWNAVKLHLESEGFQRHAKGDGWSLGPTVVRLVGAGSERSRIAGARVDDVLGLVAGPALEELRLRRRRDR